MILADVWYHIKVIKYREFQSSSAEYSSETKISSGRQDIFEPFYTLFENSLY